MQIVSPAPYLSIEERNQLLQKSDFKAMAGVFYHWGIIVGAFVMVYYYPNVVTVLIAIAILGGQQLACAILMHDASHHGVFKSKRLNNIIGNWLGAYPVFQDVIKYRDYHLQHHLNTGLDEDPDLLLTRGYPSNRKSMVRKFTRDLTGQTGIKAFIGMMMMQLGYLEFNLGNKVNRVSQKDRSWSDFFKRIYTHLSGPFMAQILIFLILYYTLSGWLYLLWIGAYLTTFQLCIRVRAIAEHSMVEDPTNPHRNTRTTKANWIEQLFFAPYHVNYHVEHHMMMAVPPYNLPKMHKLILERGFYDKGIIEQNYWSVIKKAAGY